MNIFLDIDGVMVPCASWKILENLDDGLPLFSEKAIIALRTIISENTQIVLTTSHKSRFTITEWKNIFKRRGIDIKNLKCLEENVDFLKRKDELVKWFNQNTCENFIIIDDDNSLNALPENLKKNLILTKSLIGLTLEDVNLYQKRRHQQLS